MCHSGLRRRVAAVATLLVLCIAVALPSIARSQEKARSPTWRETNVPSDIRKRNCRTQYYPWREVRYLKDVPITALITNSIDGSWTVGPAVGLDLLSLWLTPVRPECRDKNDYDYGQGLDDFTLAAPSEGFWFHFIFTANVSYTTFSTTEKIALSPPPDQPDAEGGTLDIQKAVSGLLFAGGGGFFLEWKFQAAGHGNGVALGVLARGGGFVQFDGKPFPMFTIGPAINLTRY